MCNRFDAGSIRIRFVFARFRFVRFVRFDRFQFVRFVRFEQFVQLMRDEASAATGSVDADATAEPAPTDAGSPPASEPATEVPVA